MKPKPHRLVLAIVLALATPAWAYNDAEEQARADTDRKSVLAWYAAADLCEKVETHRHGGTRLLCLARHAPDEMLAISLADTGLVVCNDPKLKLQNAPGSGCPEIRAYIKQRWGY